MQDSDSEARAAEDTRLVLMPVDPYRIYAYWSIASRKLDAAATLFEGGEPPAWVLRFHDITGLEFDGVNSRSSFDVEVAVESGKHYVRLWAPERKYCVDLGLRGKDGRLVALARSSPVETPPSWPRVRVDESEITVADAAAPIEAPPEALTMVHAEPDVAPPDAVEVLQRKLARFSALRDEPLPETPPAPDAQSPSNGDGDLTGVSEANFVPGVSSGLLGSGRPGE